MEYRENSHAVLTHLAGWGFAPEVQQRMGALVVVWGVFETNLETTLWALRNENVAGMWPSTERGDNSLGKWIDAWAEEAERLGPEAHEILKTAAKAAADLMEYRHTLMHGWVLPSPAIASFIRNPGWNGETRKRPSSDAHVDENLLDMALDAAWTLCRAVIATRSACDDA